LRLKFQDIPSMNEKFMILRITSGLSCPNSTLKDRIRQSDNSKDLQSFIALVDGTENFQSILSKDEISLTTSQMTLQ